MTDISTKGILSSVVPRLYFKRVILESGSKNTGQYTIKDDPHIDTTTFQEGEKTIHLGGWKEDHDNESSEQLIVKVEASLKQVYDPTNPGGLWASGELLELLRCGMMVSINPADIEEFSKPKQAYGHNQMKGSPETIEKLLNIALLDSNFVFNPPDKVGSLQKGAFDLRQQVNLRDVIANFPQDEAKLYATGVGNINAVAWGMNEDSSNDGGPSKVVNKMARMISHENSDGTTTLDIPVNFEFIIPNTSNPSELVLYAAVGFDQDAIGQDANLVINEDTGETKELWWSDFGILSPFTTGDEYDSLNPSGIKVMEEMFEFSEQSSEVVIRNGSPQLFGYIFKIAEQDSDLGKIGDIWTGPVHIYQEQWYTGDKQVLDQYLLTPEPQSLLSVVQVPNGVLQDFRIRKKIKKYKLDLGFIRNPTSPFGQELLTGDDWSLSLIDIIKPNRLKTDTTYFSEAWTSRDPVAGANIFFALDYEELLKKKVVFPQFIEHAGLYDLIRDKSPIEYFEVFRRRVHPLEKSTHDANDAGVGLRTTQYDKNEAPKSIGVSKDWKTGKTTGQSFAIDHHYLKDIHTGVNSKPAYNTIIKEFENFPTVNQEYINYTDGFYTGPGGTPLDMRYFNVTDRNIHEEKNTGFYQYGVKLKIKDGSVDIIKTLFEYLLLLLPRLENYHSLSSMRGHYNLATNRFTNKFITQYSADLPKDFTDIENAPGMLGFDSLYPADFLEFLESYENQVNAGFSYITKLDLTISVGLYMRILLLLNPTSMMATEHHEMYYNLLNLLLPETGTPEGINIVLDLYNKLIKQLEVILNSLESGNTYKRNNQHEEIEQQKSVGDLNRYIEIETWLEGTIDATTDKYAGYDYFGEAILRADNIAFGLPYVPINNFQVRVEQEYSKYFQNPADLGDAAASADAASDIIKYYTSGEYTDYKGDQGKTPYPYDTFLYQKDMFVATDKDENAKFGYLSPASISLNGKVVVSQQMKANMTWAYSQANKIDLTKNMSALDDNDHMVNNRVLMEVVLRNIERNRSGGIYADYLSAGGHMADPEDVLKKNMGAGFLDATLSSPFGEYWSVNDNHKLMKLINSRSSKIPQIVLQGTEIIKKTIVIGGISTELPATLKSYYSFDYKKIKPFFGPALLDTMRENLKGWRLSSYNQDSSFCAWQQFLAFAPKHMIPNQHKSLGIDSIDPKKAPPGILYSFFMYNDDGNLIGLDENNYGTYMLNYHALASIDVFLGFKKDQINMGPNKVADVPGYSMKKPKWGRLTKTMLNGMKEEKKPALCRLRPYSYKYPTNQNQDSSPVTGNPLGNSWEYAHNKNMYLPIYNEHFIIRF